jgi:hypothetical protein
MASVGLAELLVIGMILVILVAFPLVLLLVLRGKPKGPGGGPPHTS